MEKPREVLWLARKGCESVLLLLVNEFSEYKIVVLKECTGVHNDQLME